MKEEGGEARFYLTPPHPCSYLPDRTAQTMFLDPREAVATELYTALSSQGFRRSGAHLYRPRCEGCTACIPSRIPVAAFAPNRSQRRANQRNVDLRYVLTTAEYSPEVFALYDRYVAARHRDGDMYPASPDQFKSFLLCHWSETFFLRAYLEDTLMAVAVLDRLDDGLSAIYTFFDASDERRSLGKQMILEEIALCRKLGLPHLYLGYWVNGADKMRYKTDFKPVELFVNGRWSRQ